MSLYNKSATTPAPTGGSCGCSGKSKLFGGKRKRSARTARAAARRNRNHKTRRVHRKRLFSRRRRTLGGLGDAESARNVIPLNRLNDDPIHSSVSARLESRGGRRHRRTKRGGGVMDWMQDPLLGKNPGAITGFGSSAGLSNTFQLLAGDKYNASGMGAVDPAKTVGLGVSPKV